MAKVGQTNEQLISSILHVSIASLYCQVVMAISMEELRIEMVKQKLKGHQLELFHYLISYVVSYQGNLGG